MSDTPIALPGFPVFEAIAATAVVLGLLGLTLWLLRRGVYQRRGQGRMSVEETLPLGERRSLMIVSIEGRRLVVGTAPGHVGLVAELTSATAERTPTDASSGVPVFDRRRR